MNHKKLITNMRLLSELSGELGYLHGTYLHTTDNSLMNSVIKRLRSLLSSLSSRLPRIANNDLMEASLAIHYAENIIEGKLEDGTWNCETADDYDNEDNYIDLSHQLTKAINASGACIERIYKLALKEEKQ